MKPNEILEGVRQFIATNQSAFIDQLCDFLRIPSVSTDPDYREDVCEAADFLARHMKDIGVAYVEVIPTRGHPIVMGHTELDPRRPTVLVYGHYDVQPPDPYDLWESPPFEPDVRNGRIYARGAADDKGQLFGHLKAFEWMHQNGVLPCNVKFVFEGEEEIGSPHLARFLAANHERLACDVVLVSDTSMLSLQTPSITVGLRGLSYFEITFRGPDRDLHSGIYGGALLNPANALANLIASLHDPMGRITVPHLYDEVAPPSPEEHEVIEYMRIWDAKIQEEAGVLALSGEAGLSAYERIAFRPSLDVNGMWSGYTGEGSKTIIPAEAHAKFSIRLVPNQQHEKINELVRKFVDANIPKGIKASLKVYHGGDPYWLSPSSLEYRAASAAIADVFGKRALPLRTGGSIPVVSDFKKHLGAETVLLGFGLDSDAIHSPNEHFGVENFLLEIQTIPLFHWYYAHLKQAGR